MPSKETVFNLNTHQGSKLTYLTDPTAAGKIKYLAGTTTPQSAADVDTGITGIVIPIGHGALDLGQGTSDGFNQIGDPGEKGYSLTSGDLQITGPAAGIAEKDGGAQKFVNAVLDSAFVAYDSGVKQGSGLSSMTISRGDLTLNNSKVTGISGVVNTYSRSYSVTFSYKQSGMITAGATAALPDITNDLATEAGDGPF
jgi:hypothetical protein